MKLPKLIHIIRCTDADNSYEDLVGITVAPIDRIGDRYIIDEYHYRAGFWFFYEIKTSDCKIVTP